MWSSVRGNLVQWPHYRLLMKFIEFVSVAMLAIAMAMLALSMSAWRITNGLDIVYKDGELATVSSTGDVLAVPMTDAGYAAHVPRVTARNFTLTTYGAVIDVRAVVTVMGDQRAVHLVTGPIAANSTSGSLYFPWESLGLTVADAPRRWRLNQAAYGTIDAWVSRNGTRARMPTTYTETGIGIVWPYWYDVGGVWVWTYAGPATIPDFTVTSARYSWHVATPGVH